MGEYFIQKDTWVKIQNAPEFSMFHFSLLSSFDIVMILSATSFDQPKLIPSQIRKKTESIKSE